MNGKVREGSGFFVICSLVAPFQQITITLKKSYSQLGENYLNLTRSFQDYIDSFIVHARCRLFACGNTSW